MSNKALKILDSSCFSHIEKQSKDSIISSFIKSNTKTNLSNIQNSNCDGDDPFDIGNGQKVLFKNLRIKPLENAPEMRPQPEEEKMIKVNNLINKIKSGPLNKNCKINN